MFGQFALMGGLLFGFFLDPDGGIAFLALQFLAPQGFSLLCLGITLCRAGG